MPELSRSIEEILRQRQRQFLVHSFLYYQFDESVIKDWEYDFFCKDMVWIMEKHPEVAAKSKYYELCLPCGKAGSGFYIDEYPPEIITASLRHLYHHKEPPEDFGEYIKRFGFRIIS